MEELEEILPTIKNIFSEWNLKINREKTEFVDFKLSEELNQRGNEKWRTNRILGSLACTTKDVMRRIILGNAAFGKYVRLWHGKDIEPDTKIRIYEATVTSIMLYNSSSWSATSQTLEKLNAAHRKHIRKILNIKWYDKIRNEELYRQANVTSLSSRVEKNEMENARIRFTSP